jgi:hypothetical protein
VAKNHFIAANAISLLRRLQADAGDVFSGNWEQIALGPGTGAGRPGQVIRLHPKTHQRHMDWLTWCRRRHRPQAIIARRSRSMRAMALWDNRRSCIK